MTSSMSQTAKMRPSRRWACWRASSKQVLGSPPDDITAVVDAAVDQRSQAEGSWPAVDQCDVDDRVRRLERRVLIELPLDDVRVGALLEHDQDPGAVRRGRSGS